MFPRDTLRRPTLQDLQTHQPLWLSATGWGLAHGCLGALLLDFNASPAIWLLLVASSLLPFYPRWVIPTPLRTWAPALTLAITLIGISLPAWALFLMAIPMSILFVSLTLTGNQPVKTSLINSLAVYGCSTLFISLIALLLGMSQGDRFTLLTALIPLGIAAITLPLCAPPLSKFSRSIHNQNNQIQLWPIWLCGSMALLCLVTGAWAIQSPWAIALVGAEITPPMP